MNLCLCIQLYISIKRIFSFSFYSSSQSSKSSGTVSYRTYLAYSSVKLLKSRLANCESSIPVKSSLIIAGLNFLTSIRGCSFMPLMQVCMQTRRIFLTPIQHCMSPRLNSKTSFDLPILESSKKQLFNNPRSRMVKYSSLPLSKISRAYIA